jgi:hypothetical protein
MTRSATRRAVRAGWLERAFSQDAPTNFKSLHHKQGWHRFGAGLFYRKIDAKRIATFQRDGFTSRY